MYGIIMVQRIKQKKRVDILDYVQSSMKINSRFKQIPPILKILDVRNFW